MQKIHIDMYTCSYVLCYIFTYVLACYSMIYASNIPQHETDNFINAGARQRGGGGGCLDSGALLFYEG